jgi:Endoribonuclease L-PSP
MREVIEAPLSGLDLRQHYGHHQSPAIRAGGLIFCSGMLPVDPETGERRHGTLTSEAHVILGNLKLLLASAGSSLDRLVQGARADLRQHRVRRAQPRLSAIRGWRTAGAHRMDGADRGGLQGPTRRDRCRMMVREGYR